MKEDSEKITLVVNQYNSLLIILNRPRHANAIDLPML